MLALVTGGASSGKSAVAERLALALPAPHVYLATMRRGGAEAERRIARHRRMREGKGFRTVELEDLLAASPAPEGAEEAFPREGTVLLEDLGNLLANGWEGMLDSLLACENAVVVGNEVGCDGVRYGGFTHEYVRRLGALSCRIAAQADLVVEVVAGAPFVVKGDPGAGRTVVAAAGVREGAPWLS